ncbi:hypothetical protein [Isoptericola sediminis]|uniref:Uncharacterized protein n=1 Tax=Isoptericola sediminis TaxID=2733572 RepID=A0A849K509_9MICO|nr:hypothetical protein [Isoptericola sediminis]NNU27480.1 hypothetical protein [Isoptericola sediminis]
MSSTRRGEGDRGIERVPLRDVATEVPPEARREPPTRPPEPLPVTAWVTDGRGRTFRADGEALAWTPRAVYVRYVDPVGREGFAWLWASAVSRR